MVLCEFFYAESVSSKTPNRIEKVLEFKNFLLVAPN